MVGWRDLGGGKRWSHSTMWLRVKCNEPRNEPPGVSPSLKLFHSKSCCLASPGKSTHDMFVFMSISLNNAKSDNSNYKAITVGVSPTVCERVVLHSSTDFCTDGSPFCHSHTDWECGALDSLCCQSCILTLFTHCYHMRHGWISTLGKGRTIIFRGDWLPSENEFFRFTLWLFPVLVSCIDIYRAGYRLVSLDETLILVAFLEILHALFIHFVFHTMTQVLSLYGNFRPVMEKWSLCYRSWTLKRKISQRSLGKWQLLLV